MTPSPSSNTNEETALECGRHLNDLKKPLIRRMNALFMLRKIGGDVAVDEISRCLVDASELLNHELAYCLGQMKNVRALPLLQKIVANTELAVIIRHEAAEAVACMGGEESAQLLERFCEDQQVEVAETCQLAVKRIRWNQQQQQKKNNNDDDDEHNNLLLVNRVFDCVDPTPSGFDDGERNLKELEAILLNADEDLFAKYRAMFALRDLQTDEATLVLAKGLKCPQQRSLPARDWLRSRPATARLRGRAAHRYGGRSR